MNFLRRELQRSLLMIFSAGATYHCGVDLIMKSCLAGLLVVNFYISILTSNAKNI